MEINLERYSKVHYIIRDTVSSSMVQFYFRIDIIRLSDLDAVSIL